MTTSARNEAARLLALGYHVIPLAYKSKKPSFQDWQHLLLSPSELDTHFPESKQFNLGILLGTEVSDGRFLVAVDVDTEEPLVLSRIRLALPNSIPYKRGLKGYTAFVVSRTSIKKSIYRIRPAESKLGQIEILGRGQQTVLPPSLHPDTHDNYVWLNDDPLPAPTALPFIEPSHLDELQLIAQCGADPGGSPVFLLNELQWLGPNKGGNVDDSVLRATAALVERGWTDDQIIARVNQAVSRMLASCPVASEWDELVFGKRLVNTIDTARRKGFDQPRKRKTTKADQRLDAATSFAQLAGGADSYWNDSGTLRHYSDGVWSRVDPLKLRHQVASHIFPIGGFDSADVSAIIQIVHDLARHYERRPSHLIACTNGVVDMNTGVLLPHSPDFYITAKLPFAYDPEARCPLYDAFLLDLLHRNPDEEKGIGDMSPEDVQRAADTFNEFMGLTLVPDNSFQKALVIQGETRSGKSTLQKLVTDLHDPDAVSAVSISRIQDERYAGVLKDTLINVSAEMSHNTYVDEETFKLMVSGDSMDFRRLYEQPVRAACSARFFIVCNEMFRTRDPSGAVEQRLIVLITRGTVPESQRDPTLLDRLREEMPGILLRFMEGYRRLKKRGRFEPPSYVQREMDRFTLENSPTLQWIHDRTHEGQMLLDPDYQFVRPATVGTPSNVLYNDYQDWCEQNGHKPASATLWGTLVKRLGYPACIRKRGGVTTRTRDLHLIRQSSF